jgi:hypothetical protein
MRKNLLATALMFGVGLATVGFMWLFILSLDHKKTSRTVAPISSTAQDKEVQPEKEQDERPPLPPPPKEVTFDGELDVDYDQSLKEAIRKSRHDPSGGIFEEKYFPRTKDESGKKKVSYKLFSFGNHIGRDDLVPKMGESGCRPATLRELLAFEEQKHDPARKFEVVALGTSPTYNPDFIPWTGKGTKNLDILYLQTPYAFLGHEHSYRWLGIKK